MMRAFLHRRRKRTRFLASPTWTKLIATKSVLFWEVLGMNWKSVLLTFHISHVIWLKFVVDLIVTCLEPSTNMAGRLFALVCIMTWISPQFERAKQFLKVVKPRWLWVSPPCGPTSPVQNLNQKTEKQIRNLENKVRKSRKLAKACVFLVQDHVEHGGDFGWEWPFTNGGWDFPVVKSLTRWLAFRGQNHKVRLDGCQVGARTHDTHELMLKPWKILTSSHVMAQ